MRTNINRLIAAFVCALALSSVALAQGFFYKEVAKDGRIYVFNLGPEYERWAQTGETGRAITKLNYGPAGETVVFDSEEAIDLYNFKHGDRRSGDQAQAAPARTRVARRQDPHHHRLGLPGDVDPASDALHP